MARNKTIPDHILDIVMATIGISFVSLTVGLSAGWVWGIFKLGFSWGVKLWY